MSCRQIMMLKIYIINPQPVINKTIIAQFGQQRSQNNYKNTKDGRNKRELMDIFFPKKVKMINLHLTISMITLT